MLSYKRNRLIDSASQQNPHLNNHIFNRKLRNFKVMSHLSSSLNSERVLQFFSKAFVWIYYVQIRVSFNLLVLQTKIQYRD